MTIDEKQKELESIIADSFYKKGYNNAIDDVFSILEKLTNEYPYNGPEGYGIMLDLKEEISEQLKGEDNAD